MSGHVSNPSDAIVQEAFETAIKTNRLDLHALRFRNDTSPYQAFRITDDFLIEVVVPFLKAHPEVNKVDLRDNVIGDRGIQALASITSIEDLDLKNNHCTDVGAFYLAQNSTIKIISVANNKIGTAGAIQFGTNKTLQYLDIGMNSIGDTGVSAFTGMTSLVYLCVINCGVSMNGILPLIALPNLKNIYAHDNQIDSLMSAKHNTELNDRRINAWQQQLNQVCAVWQKGCDPTQNTNATSPILNAYSRRGPASDINSLIFEEIRKAVPGKIDLFC